MTGAIKKNSVGILPVGALGIGFFHHLTDSSRRLDGSVVFLDRPGSTSAQAIHAAGGISLRDATGEIRQLTGSEVLGGNLVDHLRQRVVPEVIIVACNPDQLLDVVSHLVEFVCAGHAQFGLAHLDEWMPAVVLASNGIYFQRVRLIYGEKLEEAALYERLPHLWPDFSERLLGWILRGVSMQTGVREGSGGGAIYRPGPPGQTKIGGGEAAVRERAAAVLSGLGGGFVDTGPARPTRLEFDKGLINLASNLLGQLFAIDDDGRFTPLTVGEIHAGPHLAELLALTRRVIEVGQAVGAYGPAEDPVAIHHRVVEAALVNRSHVPSSLQHVGLALADGTLEPRLAPTERWLIEPLIRYARSAGLDEAVAAFRELRARVIQRLELAIAYSARASI